MPEFPAGSAISPPWITIAGSVGYLGSWADNASAPAPGAYRLWADKNEVEGYADLAVPTFSGDSNIFTLPVGYRPLHGQSFPALILTSSSTTAFLHTPRAYFNGSTGTLVADQSTWPDSATGKITRAMVEFRLKLDW